MKGQRVLRLKNFILSGVLILIVFGCGILLMSCGKKKEPIEAITNFASCTDEAGNVSFSWDEKVLVDYVNVSINKVGIAEETVEKVLGTSWKYCDMTADVRYTFKFTPFVNGKAAKTLECSRFFNQSAKEIDFARVEITTEGFVWPTCDYITHPNGAIGEGITNANYVQSKVNIFDNAGSLVFDSETIGADFTGSKVKVRGNTSAYSAKKPYKIKLNKKVDLLSSLISGRDDGKDYRDKNWILLAQGESIKTLVGWGVSEALNMDWTPAYAYVSLYVNGDYCGLYILCESVKEGNGVGEEQSRLQIDEDGFIIEADAYWWNEDLYFSSTINKFTFKYPDTDDINETSPEFNYIKQYVIDLENALKNGGTDYQNYIDEDTFAKWLLGHDLLGTVDGAGSNIYMTKKDSSASKLRMSMLWDFDSIGHCSSYSTVRNGDWFYFPLLLKQENFAQAYNQTLNEVKGHLVETVAARIDSAFDANAYGQLLNLEHHRWGLNHNLDAEKDFMLSYIEQRTEWLKA